MVNTPMVDRGSVAACNVTSGVCEQCVFEGSVLVRDEFILDEDDFNEGEDDSSITAKLDCKIFLTFSCGISTTEEFISHILLSPLFFFARPLSSPTEQGWLAMSTREWCVSPKSKEYLLKNLSVLFLGADAASV